MTQRRLYLHVGLMKTGTSYLQSVLWQTPQQLRDQGLELVPPTPAGQFWLMLDVRDRYQPGRDPSAAGRAVRRFPQQLARSTSPRALVTAESLAPATDEQIDRLLAACASHEVHVVVTARDLARQIPSAWQQRLRRGSAEEFDKYLTRLRRTEASGEGALWRQKDLVGVLQRWSRDLPPSRMHVVIVPPAGNPPQQLLERFCRVLELDPSELRPGSVRTNEALGHVGAELLRRVNDRIDPELKQRQTFGEVGKRYFALGILSAGTGRRILMPSEWKEWCRSVAERQVDYLCRSGFDIVGDPRDLVPADSSFTGEDHRPTDAELAEAGADALAAVLTDRLVDVRQRREASTQESHGSAPPRAGGLAWLGSKLRSAVTTGR